PRAGGGQSGLDEDRLDVGVALAVPGPAAPAGGLVVTRGEPGPRGQMLRGREPAHVHADLADDHRGDPVADPGNAGQQLDLLGERRDEPGGSGRNPPAAARGTAVADLLSDLGAQLVEGIASRLIDPVHPPSVHSEPAGNAYPPRP